ncbi:MAG: two-component regulator propeller domain-containing protein [Bacteroidota bacterium]
MNRIITVWLCGLAMIPCLLQGKLPPIQFEQIRTSSGLSSDMVFCIAQDQEGFMWFGTSNGLNRYDGKEFYIFRADSINPNSLNNDIIKSLLVDSQGILWIGTQGGGLNRMDIKKRSITHYLHDPTNSNSLTHNEILDLHEDENGLIWIGTENGLSILNPDTDTFYNFFPDPGTMGQLAAPAVLEVHQDPEGVIWLGTWGGGLHKMLWDQTEAGLANAYFEYYRHDPNNPNTIVSDRLWSMDSDTQGRLWIGTGGAQLAIKNTSSCTEIGLESFIHLSGKKGKSLGDIVFSCFVDSKGLAWVGTKLELSVFDTKSIDACLKLKNDWDYKIFHHNSIGLAGLPSNRIRDIYESKNGIIWLATEGGIAKYDPQITVFHAELNGPKYESLKEISTISVSPTRGMWVGTRANGLFLIDENKEIRDYITGSDNTAKGNLLSNFIGAIWEDTLNEILWLGSEKGISRLDIKSWAILNYPFQLKEVETYFQIRDILPKSDQELWISSSQGLLLFNKNSGRFKLFREDPRDPQSLPDNFLGELIRGEDGSFWVGSDDGGLIHILPQENAPPRFESIFYDPHDLASLNNKNYRFLASTEKKIWIGTTQGLFCYDKSKRKMQAFGDIYGSNSINISQMLVDREGNIWCSNSVGISRFDPKVKRFINFDHRHGLIGTNFYDYPSYQDHEGTMYFCSEAGLNEVRIENLNQELKVPAIFLSGLRLNTKELVPGQVDPLLGEIILKQDIRYTDHITIDHSHKIIDIDFALIEYSFSEKNQATYRLEGFEETWNTYDNDRTISYTNLDPGTYQLHIKAANSNGEWSEDKIYLTIEVLPPFWETWIFKLGALCGIFLLTYAAYQLRVRQVRNQNLELQKKVADRTQELQMANEREKEARAHAESAARSKSEFLANMSHEIRTPMNGMLGMAELLNDEALSPEQKNYVSTIIKSGESLLSIINDILDFSKIESGKLELENSPFSVRDCVEEVLGLFAGKLGDKPVEFLYFIDPSLPAHIMGDGLRLRQVLLNLVSNALKFTAKGEIIIKVDKLPSEDSVALEKGAFKVRFSLSDTGIGIPKKKIETLFDAFTQVDASTTRKYGGTGLGLAISSRLVKLMGGEFMVESEVGKGTEFSFHFATAAPADPALFAIPSLDLTPLQDKEVLLIDAHHLHGKMIAEQLTKWGCIVNWQKNLKAAAAYLNTHPKTDLIINNSPLPTKEDWSRIKALLAKSDAKKLQLASLFSFKQIKQRGLFDKVLAKPLAKRSFYDTLVSVFAEGSPVIKTVASQDAEKAYAIDDSLHILLAEDNLVNQKLALKMLEKIGYKADLAVNGKDAYEKVLDSHYDLVLMDVQMPEMDGLEVTQKIRKQASVVSQPIIIAVTANAMQGDKEMCLAAGMDDYITKPFKQKDLLSVIEKFRGVIKQ